MGGLSDLDFSPSLEIERIVRDRFASMVSFHPQSSSPEFFLIALFGRSALRLNVDSVSLILQSCLGGKAKDFIVQFMSESMYRFSVSSKSVGFLVYKLQFIKCNLFAIFFALWGNRGPNSLREYDHWLQECVEEWTYVGSKKSKTSNVQTARSPPMYRCKSYAQAARVAPKSSFTTSKSMKWPLVFSRISFSSYGDALRAAGNGAPPGRKSIFDRLSSLPRSQEEKGSKVQNSNAPRDHRDPQLSCARCLSLGHLAQNYARDIHVDISFLPESTAVDKVLIADEGVRKAQLIKPR
uniref:Uncharacterized protein n=1 Tax=Setaria italica TaxID=4555 RepID=K3YC35_SETIT